MEPNSAEKNNSAPMGNVNMNANMGASPKPGMSWAIPVAIIVAAVVIAAAILIGLFAGKKSDQGTSGAAAQAAAQAAPSSGTVDVSKISGGNDPFYGNANAPVTLYYFFDYQCPFCKQNELTVMPEVLKNYVATGQVKIVYKDFEFLGPDSVTVGEWARAVWQLYPSQFQAWHDAIFANEGTENSGWVTVANLTKYTQTVPGIDVSKVQAAIAANKTAYDAAIAADKAQGTAIGIQGTPSFVIGNQLVVGAEPYATISSAIDSALKAAK